MLPDGEKQTVHEEISAYMVYLNHLRRIKKIILKSEERWGRYDHGTMTIPIKREDYIKLVASIDYCNIFEKEMRKKGKG